ncbi:MAG: hypothetical protein WBN41_02755 [Lysobacterales bacterium]
MNHSPCFYVTDKVLSVGVEALSNLALEWVYANPECALPKTLAAVICINRNAFSVIEITRISLEDRPACFNSPPPDVTIGSQRLF